MNIELEFMSLEVCEVMNNFSFGEDLKKRTKKFAIDVITFTKKLPYTSENKIFVNQIVRSATSVASNYRAACRGRSKAEFYSKISIVLEESDETQFWLEMIESFNSSFQIQISILNKEAGELVKIFSASRKTMNESKFNP
jgi:four helix bundle protein